MDNQKQLLLNALLSIEENVPDRGLGIYPNMDIVTDCNLRLQWQFEAIAKKWPHYTGNDRYPVPSPYETTAIEEYQWRIQQGYLYSDGDMWSGRYGQLRKDLLAFVIAELKKELQ